MNKDILTTSEAAKLLGVSVRTVQLLVEGGALKSWKTPGGHRRVYRADILDFMARSNPTPALHSARLLLLASAERLPLLERALAGITGWLIEPHADPFSASFSMGLRPPAAVVVDLESEAGKHMSFLEHVVTNTSFSRTKLIVLGPLPSEGHDLIASRLLARADTTAALAETVQAALRDYAAPDPLFPEPPSFPVAPNERERLAAVDRSGLLDTGPEEAFDRLAWLASHSLKAPIALVAMLTPTQQVFKSRYGLDLTETPRDWAFCNYTILQDDVFAVDDLARDERFASNPVVMNDPHFRFYAGVPIVDPDGFTLASLCIIDYEPRHLDSDQERTLQLLAQIGAAELRSRVGRETMARAHSSH